MSVLFGLVAAVAAKLAPRDVEMIRLKAEIDALKRERDEARAQNEILEAEIVRWRRRDQRFVEPQAQSLQAQAQLQMAQYMTMHANALQNQLAQTPQNVMLGAQNLNLGYEWCNCVPARHDLLAPRHEA